MQVSQSTFIKSSQMHDEKDAHECAGGPNHRGWYTDGDGTDKIIGVVASLPNGRFITGYRWASTGERVYLNGVYTDETEAARMADEHARVFAEAVMEDSARYEAMRDAEDNAEEKRKVARLAIMARNVSLEHREMAREAIDGLRAALEFLNETAAAYENA